MRDIGQHFYEEKEYYFNQIAISRIIINPSVRGYPPLFMVCSGDFGSKQAYYILAMNFLQINKLLMKSVENSTRLILAEKLTDFLIPGDRSGEICIRKTLGEALTITNLDITTRVHRFNSDSTTEDEPLYYFQLTEME